MYVWISNDFDKQLDQIWNQQISQLCIFILPANPKYHLKIKTTPGVYSLGVLVLGGRASDVWMCLNMWCTPQMAIPKQKTGRTRWFRGTLFSDQSMQEWKGRSYLGVYVMVYFWFFRQTHTYKTFLEVASQSLSPGWQAIQNLGAGKLHVQVFDVEQPANR